MSRPKPTVITEVVNRVSHKKDQILAADGIFAIFYDGSPINLKTECIVNPYPAPKYKKTSFANPGHAINLCKKLNTQFKTNKFSVVCLNQGQQLFPIKS